MGILLEHDRQYEFSSPEYIIVAQNENGYRYDRSL